MFSFGKYVPITSIAEKDKQFSKNESSGQNFMRTRDDVRVKIIELRRKLKMSVMRIYY